MTWTVDASGTKTPTVQGTVTMTIASPCVVSVTNTLAAGDMVSFTTTGALPTGVVAGTTYFVQATGLTGSAFRISATLGGADINTSGSQSGVHTGSFEHVLATPNTNATYVFSADTVNMVNIDFAEFRCYDMVDGTNYRQMWRGSFQHVQINNGKAAPPMAVTTQARFTLKQTAGTARAFPWSVRRI